MKRKRGTTSTHHRMRCSRCKTRFTVKQGKLLMLIARGMWKGEVSCPFCSSVKVYSCEAARLRELEKQERCHCLPIPFPHRKGSILGCDHHPVDPADWTEEQERQFDGMLSTPRGNF